MTLKLTKNNEYGLYENNNQIYCDSLQIAETFKKRHDNVLSSIDKILKKDSGLSEDFRQLKAMPSLWRGKYEQRCQV